MIFRDRLKNHKALMMLGMVFLIIANLWPRFIHLVVDLSPDWIDATHGMLYGLAIGLLLLSVRLNCRQRRGGGNSSHC